MSGKVGDMQSGEPTWYCLARRFSFHEESSSSTIFETIRGRSSAPCSLDAEVGRCAHEIWSDFAPALQALNISAVRWAAVGLMVHRDEAERSGTIGANIYAWHFWHRNVLDDSAITALHRFGGILADPANTAFLIGNVAEHLFSATRALDWVLRLTLPVNAPPTAFACDKQCDFCGKHTPQYVENVSLGGQVNAILDRNNVGWKQYVELIDRLGRDTGSTSIWYCPIPSYQRVVTGKSQVLASILGGGVIVATDDPTPPPASFVPRLATMQAAQRMVVGELRLAAPEIGTASSKANAIAEALRRAYEAREFDEWHTWAHLKTSVDLDAAYQRLCRLTGLDRGSLTGEEKAERLFHFAKVMTQDQDPTGAIHPSIFPLLFRAIGVPCCDEIGEAPADFSVDLLPFNPIVPSQWTSGPGPTFVEEKIGALRALLRVVEAVQRGGVPRNPSAIATWAIRFWALPLSGDATGYYSTPQTILETASTFGAHFGFFALELVPRCADGSVSNALPRVAADVLAGREGDCAAAFRALGATGLISTAGLSSVVPTVDADGMFSGRQLEKMIHESRSHKTNTLAQLLLYGGRLLLVHPRTGSQ